MPNMFDYMDWRGDLTFKQSKFNEVDNLIISQLCYAPFSNLVGDGASSIRRTLFDVANDYYEKYSEEDIENMANQEQRASKVLKAMANSRRFRDCILADYFECHNIVTEQQFAAMTVDVNTDVIYVVYRGTDNSIVGWKEDFNMTKSSHLQSQKDALNYLENIAKKYPEKMLFVGGHSKGGNLAVYSSIFCSDEVKERIVRVYNNDGPGFLRDVVESDEYKAILPKVRTIVPESSIIGMLLEHEEDYTVVRSSASGGMQHDCTSWEVLGRHFIYLENTSKKSKILDDAMTSYFYSLSEEQLSAVIDGIYLVITSAGFTTLDSLQDGAIKSSMSLIKEYNSLDKADKKYIMQAIKGLFKEGGRTFRKVIPHPFAEEDD